LKEKLLTYLRERREWSIPALLFAAALAVRLYLLLTHRYPLMLQEQDGISYMEVAKKIRALQPFFNDVRPPSYPFIIALFSLLPMDLELAARTASIFMDALITIPLYLIGRTFLSRTGAAVAGLLWAFFSFSLYFSLSPLSQSTFLFFLCCGIIAFIRGIEGEKWRPGLLCLAGVFFALSYQARPEGVVPFGFAGAVLLLLLLVKKHRMDKLRGGLLFAAGFILAAGPYLVYLRLLLGQWGFTAKSEIALKGVDGTLVLDAGGKLSQASHGIGVWKAYYVSFGNLFSVALTNMTQFAAVMYQVFPLWVHLLAAVGAVVLIARRKWPALICLALLAVATLPVYIVNIPKAHSYIYSLFPVELLLFAVFWDEVKQAAEKVVAPRLPSPESGIWQGVVPTLIIIPALLLSINFFVTARTALEAPGLVHETLLTEKVFRQSGRFVRDNSGPSDRIMARWGLIGYYADRDVITLPKGGVQVVISYGRKNGARLLVIDTISVLSRRQELMELLDPLQGRGINKEYGLEPVSMNYDPEYGGYVIYRYIP
jgi:4-amino-4-deoxy-L-arabinose transferase-like glycosyltransferase